MTRPRRAPAAANPAPVLTGKQAATLLRRWLARDGFSPTQVDGLLAAAEWRDSHEPLLAEQDLIVQYGRWLGAPADREPTRDPS